MNEGLKNLIQYTHRNLEDLWRVTSYNQAKALNILHQKVASVKVNMQISL